MAMAVSGCSSTTLLREQSSATAKANALGFYTLPRPSLNVSVFFASGVDGDGLIVGAEPARVVTGESLPLSAVFSAMAKDDFKIDVDPATGFLKKISLTNEDQTTEIAKELGATIGAVTSFNPTFLTVKTQSSVKNKVQAPVRIATAVFDPSGDLTATNQALWRQTLAYLSWRRELCKVERRQAVADQVQKRDKAIRAAKTKVARRAAAASPIVEPADLEACLGGDLLRLVPENSTAEALAVTSPFVTVALPPGSAPKPVDAAQKPCAGMGDKGVCVRVAREIQVGLQAPNGSTVWQSARLPIPGEEYLLNVQRAMFANKVFVVEFADGLAGSRQVSQTSQALTIVGAPKVLIDSFIDSLGKTTTAISNIIPIRLEYRYLRRPGDRPADAKDAADAEDETPSEDASADKPTDKPADKPADKPVDKSAEKPPAATSSTVGVTTPGGGPTVNVTVTTSPPAKPDTPDKPSADPSLPKLWFAACSFSLACTSQLNDQLPIKAAENNDLDLGPDEKPGGAATPGKKGDAPAAKPGDSAAAKPDCRNHPTAAGCQ